MKKTISALLILIGFLSIKAGMPGQYSGTAEKLELNPNGTFSYRSIMLGELSGKWDSLSEKDILFHTDQPATPITFEWDTLHTSDSMTALEIFVESLEPKIKEEWWWYMPIINGIDFDPIHFNGKTLWSEVSIDSLSFAVRVEWLLSTQFMSLTVPELITPPVKNIPIGTVGRLTIRIGHEQFAMHFFKNCHATYDSSENRLPQIVFKTKFDSLVKRTTKLYK